MVSYGLYIPDTYMTAKKIPGKDDGAQDMAVRAAKDIIVADDEIHTIMIVGKYRDSRNTNYCNFRKGQY